MAEAQAPAAPPSRWRRWLVRLSRLRLSHRLDLNAETTHALAEAVGALHKSHEQLVGSIRYCEDCTVLLFGESKATKVKFLDQKNEDGTVTPGPTRLYCKFCAQKYRADIKRAERAQARA